MWSTRILSLVFFLLLPVSQVAAGHGGSRDPRRALEEARQAAEAQDFQTALEALRPYLGGDLSKPLDWEITAEAGRAAFSLGQLEEARSLLRLAVAARPTVAETAVYLEAVSYLLGDRKQALMIFEALLQGHVPDLYLAVTLPGETRFLADPDVRALLKRYAIPLEVEADSGNCLGLHLGQSRNEVIAALGLAPVSDSVLMARAGPELIWVLSFDRLGMLREVVLHADHLRRYTPYRLALGLSETPAAKKLGWLSRPQEVIAVLGAPAGKDREADGALRLRWDFPGHSLEMIFTGVPGDDFSRGHLQLLRLSTQKGPG